MASPPFTPALVIVDLQEDFCPPAGALAVASGRAVAAPINALLALPAFALRIATQDWHPPDHISFAANHPGKRPFVDTATVAQRYETRLWPVHCLQDSPGAALIPELHAARVDRVVRKGRDPRVEMYSAFRDPLGLCDSGLAAALRDDAAATHVYVVGLAFDYCVRATAVDAAREGFVTYVVEEATRAVDPAGWDACVRELEAEGVRVVSMEGEEVARLRTVGVCGS